MDSEENSSASFIPEHLQKILNVIESGETRHKWKLVRNAASFTLIINFPAKTDKAKGQGQGNQPPLKKRAYGVLACQHKDKKKASSDVRPADHPKAKKKKTPSRVARDRRRRREFWKRMKVARQLRALTILTFHVDCVMSALDGMTAGFVATHVMSGFT